MVIDDALVSLTEAMAAAQRNGRPEVTVQTYDLLAVLAALGGVLLSSGHLPALEGAAEAKLELEFGASDPAVGDYMIHVMGEGHDTRFATLADAQRAAKDEKHGQPQLPVFILRVVDVA